MNSKENQDQRKRGSRFLGWESRITDGAWWTLYGFGGMAFGFVFFPNLLVLGVFSLIWGILVKLRISKMNVRELALYHVGFLVNGLHYGFNMLYWFGSEVPIESRKYLLGFPHHLFNAMFFGSALANVIILLCFRLRWWISVPLMLISFAIDFAIAIHFWAD